MRETTERPVGCCPVGARRAISPQKNPDMPRALIAAIGKQRDAEGSKKPEANLEVELAESQKNGAPLFLIIVSRNALAVIAAKRGVAVASHQNV